jgi:hypothetical protein
MCLKKINLLLILFAVLVIPMINAEVQTLGTFKQNSDVSLIQQCINSTYANITRITYPNSSFSVDTATIMTKNGDDYSYSYNLSSLLGEYLVYGKCNENGVDVSWQYNFFITKTGYSLSLQESLIYFILLIFVTLCFVASSFLAFSIPFRHYNEYGERIFMTKSKYLKIFFITVSYGLLVWVLNLLIALSDSFVYLTQFFGFFNFLFIFFSRMSYLFIVIVLIITVYEIIIDFNFKKRLNELWGIK